MWSKPRSACRHLRRAPDTENAHRQVGAARRDSPWFAECALWVSLRRDRTPRSGWRCRSRRTADSRGLSPDSSAPSPGRRYRSHDSVQQPGDSRTAFRRKHPCVERDLCRRRRRYRVSPLAHVPCVTATWLHRARGTDHGSVAPGRDVMPAVRNGDPTLFVVARRRVDPWHVGTELARTASRSWNAAGPIGSYRPGRQITKCRRDARLSRLAHAKHLDERRRRRRADGRPVESVLRASDDRRPRCCRVARRRRRARPIDRAHLSAAPRSRVIDVSRRVGRERHAVRRETNEYPPIPTPPRAPPMKG
jgi:hypothetical protein